LQLAKPVEQMNFDINCPDDTRWLHCFTGEMGSGPGDEVIFGGERRAATPAAAPTARCPKAEHAEPEEAACPVVATVGIKVEDTKHLSDVAEEEVAAGVVVSPKGCNARKAPAPKAGIRGWVKARVDVRLFIKLRIRLGDLRGASW